MTEPEETERRPSLLGATMKTAAALAFCAYCASSWLSGTRLDRTDFSRLAASTWRAQEDPITTGSIGRAAAAAAARLDPCVRSDRR